MTLPQDTSIELAKMRALLPPEPGPTTLSGSRLTITSLEPAEYDWVQDADNELLEGIGDPNLTLNALIGTLYVDRTSGAPKLWQNQDGLDTWADLTAGGGSASFPITKDDGTSTATIDHGTPNWGAGQFALAHNELDANPSVYGDIIDFVDTDFASIVVDAQGAPGEGRVYCEGGDTYGHAQLSADDHNGHSAELFVEGSDGASGRYTATSAIALQAAEVIFAANNAAPPSADLQASQFALWLDDTNGASKLMIKAKSADGTVVTGSVALT